VSTTSLSTPAWTRLPKLVTMTTVAVVHPPSRLADEFTDPSDEHALLDLINQRLQPRFHGWVREAEKLGR
jgi:hypothetical protein